MAPDEEEDGIELERELRLKESPAIAPEVQEDWAQAEPESEPEPEPEQEPEPEPEPDEN